MGPSARLVKVEAASGVHGPAGADVLAGPPYNGPQMGLAQWQSGGARCKLNPQTGVRFSCPILITREMAIGADGRSVTAAVTPPAFRFDSDAISPATMPR